MTTNVLLNWLCRGEHARQAGAGVLAGIAAGILAGIGARIAMRIVALAVGQFPAFSIAGTLGVVMIGLLLGIPIGLLFVAMKRYLPGPRLVQGLVLGSLLLLAFTFPFAASNDELAIAPRLGLVLFAALFLVAGVTVAQLVEPIERRLPAPRRGLVSLAGYGLLLALGVAGTMFYAAIVISAIMGVDI